MTQEPVAKDKEEIKRRAESDKESKVKGGSSPSDTKENQKAPKQEKAAASPE